MFLAICNFYIPSDLFTGFNSCEFRIITMLKLLMIFQFLLLFSTHLWAEIPSDSPSLNRASRNFVLLDDKGLNYYIEGEISKVKVVRNRHPSGNSSIKAIFIGDDKSEVDFALSNIQPSRSSFSKSIKLNFSPKDSDRDCLLYRHNDEIIYVKGVCVESVEIFVPFGLRSKFYLNGEEIKGITEVPFDLLRGQLVTSENDFESAKYVQQFIDSQPENYKISTNELRVIFEYVAFEFIKVRICEILSGRVIRPARMSTLKSLFAGPFADIGINALFPSE